MGISVRRARRLLRRTRRVVADARDLVLGHGGAGPDRLLLSVAQRSPMVARMLGRAGRRRPSRARDEGLRFRIQPVDPNPYVGLGQIVAFTGWLCHADLPVRAAWLVAEHCAHPIALGYRQVGAAERLARKGWRVPERIGVRVAVPVGRVAAPRRVELVLRVQLADGAVLERALPALPVRPGAGATPLTVAWPADGPKVVICMTTYRPDARQLAEQLASIRAQTYANWVCVVCDDGSPEESRALVREFTAGDDRFRLVEHDKNVGFYRNFERTLRLLPADADAVSLCDQDDVWDVDKLACLVAEFADPSVQLAYSDMRLVDEDGGWLADSFWNPARDRNQCDDLIALIQANTVTGAASLVRAQLVRDRVLPFPPGAAFHDHWIALVALARGRIAFVDRPLYSYRQHSASVIGNLEFRPPPQRPSWVRVLLASRSDRRPLSEEQVRLMETAGGFELARLARMATVLLLRDSGGLTGEARRRLKQVAALDRRLTSVIAVTRLPRRTRELAMHADDRLLAAALWRRAQLPRWLDLPAEPSTAPVRVRETTSGAGQA